MCIIIRKETGEPKPKDNDEQKINSMDYKKAWDKLKLKLINAEKYYTKKNNYKAIQTIGLIEQYMFDLEVEL